MDMIQQQDPLFRKKVVLEAQMRWSSYQWPDQEGWVKSWADRVLVAHRNNPALRTGQHLYLMLPKEFAIELNGTLRDPFYATMEKGEIIQWFVRHITFNTDGDMDLLRDYERVLWARQNWSE